MSEPTVYIIDDDAHVLDSLRWLIESIDLMVETHVSAEVFLENYTPQRPGCLVLDVRLPGMSGLDLQDHLNNKKILLPIIMITGFGDVPSAVRAIKAGAVDFIEKPFNDQLILDTIRDALERDKLLRQRQVSQMEIKECIESLTPREQEIMSHVVHGKPTRIIAEELRISPKTVESHRARIMRKMRADSIAQLVRYTMTLI